MLQKSTMAAVMLFCTSVIGHSCDVCSGGLRNIGSGLLTAYKFNYINLNWDQQKFNQVLFTGLGSEDYYNNISLSAQHYVIPKLRVTTSCLLYTSDAADD